VRCRSPIAAIWSGVVALQILAWSPLSANAENYVDLSLDNPFPSERSIDRLEEKFPGAADERIRSVLKNISRIRYSFSEQILDCPYPAYCGNIHEPSIHWRIIHREITLGVGDLGNAINAAIQSRAFDNGCSTLRFPAFRFLSADSTIILYTVEVRALIRYCRDTWLGTIKTDIAGGWAQLFIPVVLSKTAPSLGEMAWSAGSFGLAAGYPYLHIYEFNSHFPTLDVESIASRIQANLSRFAAFDGGALSETKSGLDRFVGWLNEDSIQSVIPFLLLPKKGPVRRRITEYMREIIEIKSYMPKQSIDMDATFIKDGSTIVISYFTVVPDDLLPNIYAEKQYELKYIAGLDRDAEVVTVRPGESLWTLAKTHYGVGDIWYLVAAENGIDTSRKTLLRPGQRILLPPYWKMAQRDSCVVRVGETVWKRLQLSSSNKRHKIRPPLGSHDVDRIYPLQCLDIPPP
jgi:hypothetical protein